ncbi:MAG: Fur family ferric uptake transcriptional regulator [Candidatus Marinamargulisbacteria bacterium]
MKKLHKLFSDYLSEIDSRYTPQKQAIVDDIFARKERFEVESFISEIRSDDQKVSRATVYRTIKQLIDANLLQKILTRDGKVYYESVMPQQQQHHHLICNTCGEIFDIKEKKIEKYLEEFCKQQAFRPSYRSLHIYGECKTCLDR